MKPTKMAKQKKEALMMIQFKKSRLLQKMERQQMNLPMAQEVKRRRTKDGTKKTRKQMLQFQKFSICSNTNIHFMMYYIDNNIIFNCSNTSFVP
mmetsp:Transcript_7969/g.13361  ORF Transcript_7969/g.13361 Transcript_7969/m.13361 type:complete len:94 (+) Transcript_7969:393-674(+)